MDFTGFACGLLPLLLLLLLLLLLRPNAVCCRGVAAICACVPRGLLAVTNSIRSEFTGLVACLKDF